MSQLSITSALTRTRYRTSMSIIAAIIICTLVQLSHGQTSCTNPNGRKGNCISIYNCPALLSLIQKQPLSDTDVQFAKQSQCQNGSGQSPYICCTRESGYTDGGGASPTPRTIPPSNGNGVGTILPTLPRCGQLPAGDRIYNGNDTQLDEFQWMALLEYVTKNGNRVLNCGGSLINQRYVLTAAHCVTGAILREVGRLDRVRLGEYDLSKDKDCIGKDCADPVLNVGVEETIPHPQFDDTNPNRQFDIALVRLNQVITYTDFIKPVCLPSVVGLQSSLRAGTNLVVSGWGRTLTARQSDIKQKLYVPISDHAECKEKFATKRIEITPSQICAGGLFSEDSCDGDSGGPLMRQVNSNIIIEGVVSFGNRCGLEGWPGVYTKVSDYESWIRNSLRP